MDNDRCQPWKPHLDNDTIHCRKLINLIWTTLVLSALNRLYMFPGNKLEQLENYLQNPKPFFAPVFTNVCFLTQMC